jgi:hypothetical protein
VEVFGAKSSAAGTVLPGMMAQLADAERLAETSSSATVSS